MNVLKKTALPLILIALLVMAGCQGISSVEPQGLQRRALQRLRDSVNSSNPLLKMQAIESCVKLHLGKAPDICMKAIGSPAPLLQFAGAMGLIELPTAEAEQPLKALLSDEDESVRLAAIGALYKLGKKEYSQELISALGSADRKIRGVALTVLGRMGDKSAIKAIRPLLEGEPIESVRLQAAEALVLLGDQNALPKLQLWQYSTNYQERVFAVQLMGQVEPPPDFTADLLQALDDPNQLVQLQAARSLGRLGQQAGFGKAIKYLRPSAGMKRSIAKQMGISYEDPQLQTEITKIRSAAALALGDIGRWDAAKHLEKILDDGNAQVALAAAYATLKLLIETNQANIQTIP
ncbi:MAG: hypothetical protein GWP14_04170 [Actinobacteria bacterium]|nr:hypothetical protein [Actinomycetota bacterium]